ncbi:hypothetical protein AB2010_000627 [Citrobacter freundii]
MKPTYEELAVQLANAESKCRELAAENAMLNGAKSVSVKVAGNLARGNYFDELQTKMNRHVSVNTTTVIAFMDEAREIMKRHAGKLVDAHNIETTTTDAFLAEVRAQGVDALAQTLEGLVAVSVTRSYIMEFAAQLRKGDKS